MVRLTREENREQTRDRLRSAALQEFALLGISGTSVDRLTASAGFSRGAFYSNYDSKHELLLELLHEHQARTIAHTVELIQESGDLDQLFAHIRHTFNTYELDGNWIMLAIELRLHAERDPRFAVAYRRYDAEFKKAVRNLYLGIFRKADKRPPAPIDVIASMLERVGRGLRFDASDAQAAGHTRQSPGELFVLMLRGLLAVAEPCTVFATVEGEEWEDIS